MTDAAAYIATARKLLAGAPTDIDIKRSISTAYYALFHHACLSFSTIVLRPASATYTRAWTQAYRYLDHGSAKHRCLEASNKNRNFPAGVVVFAEAFVDLQQERIVADYDPSQFFTAANALTLIASAEKAIAAFEAETVEARRAFVVFLALRPKNR